MKKGREVVSTLAGSQIFSNNVSMRRQDEMKDVLKSINASDVKKSLVVN